MKKGAYAYMKEIDDWCSAYLYMLNKEIYAWGNCTFCIQLEVYKRITHASQGFKY